MIVRSVKVFVRLVRVIVRSIDSFVLSVEVFVRSIDAFVVICYPSRAFDLFDKIYQNVKRTRMNNQSLDVRSLKRLKFGNSFVQTLEVWSIAFDLFGKVCQSSTVRFGKL